jgi:hypothetical protein
MSLPGMAEFGLVGRVVRKALREEDAAGTLARVTSGELNRCVLPWVALMRGGGEPTLTEEWKRLADLEPDPRVRLEYAVDVLVFAELPGVRAEWRQALEGWNVLVSQQVLEWQAIAEVKTRRADLVRLLEKRCKAPVPSDLTEAIQASEDMNLLLRWFDVAAETNTFDEFRAATQAQR